MKCKKCNTEIESEPISNFGLCDDCYTKELDDDMEAYNSQNSKCFLCNQELKGWTTKIIDNTLRAICVDSCNQQTKKCEYQHIFGYCNVYKSRGNIQCKDCSYWL